MPRKRKIDYAEPYLREGEIPFDVTPEMRSQSILEKTKLGSEITETEDVKRTAIHWHLILDRRKDRLHWVAIHNGGRFKLWVFMKANNTFNRVILRFPKSSGNKVVSVYDSQDDNISKTLFDNLYILANYLTARMKDEKAAKLLHDRTRVPA